MLESDKFLSLQFLDKKYLILKNRSPSPKGLLSKISVSMVLLQKVYLQKVSKDSEVKLLSAKLR